jgi:Spy/CpxP family protein refolding chaperone
MGSTVTRSRLLAGSVLVATFFAGAMVGGATLQLLARDDVPADRQWNDSRDEHGRDRRASMLDGLGLTASQSVRIDSIFERRRQQTAQFWEAHGPQMRAIVDSTRAEIDRVLTPEQRAKAEQWREEHRKRHEQEEHDRGADRAPANGVKR